jgi:hypothetical protein
MSAMDLSVFVGMRVPGGFHASGAPLILGSSRNDLEVAIPFLLGAVPLQRAQVTMLQTRYSVALGFYHGEVQHLFALFAARDLGPMPLLPGTRPVTCGFCSRCWTSATVAEVQNHSCSGVNMHPAVALQAVPVVLPPPFQVSARYRPGFLRIGLLRDTVVGLFRELEALQRVEAQLEVYCQVVADNYHLVVVERAMVRTFATPRYTLHPRRALWQCHRGCLAFHDEWAEHICPRLGWFAKAVITSDGAPHLWEATGIRLPYWCY